MLRGGGRRQQPVVGVQGVRRAVVALLAIGLVALLLPSGALAEGRPTESWENAYEDASQSYREGDLQQALARARRARELIGQVGTDRRDALAQTLNLEAVLLDRLGRHGESEPLYRQALKLREEGLHPEDPRIAESLNNLAVALDLLGRHREAEALHKRALAVREKAFGPFHPDVAQSLNNLAKVQLALGRSADAGPLLRRAIAILSGGRGQGLTRSQLDLADFSGTEHEPDEGVQHVGKVGAAMPGPGMAAPPPRPRPSSRSGPELSLSAESDPVSATQPADTSLHEADLAVTLLNLGMMAQTAYTGPKQDEAGLLYRRAIAIQEKVLGPEHPDVAASLNNLAELSRIQWRYREAERLHKRALAIREKALGPDHPLTAASLTNLARLYSVTRRPETAAPLLERAVAISAEALGPDHPDVALAVRSLAMTYAALGDYGKALDLHRRASRSVIAHALAFGHGSDPDDSGGAQKVAAGSITTSRAISQPFTDRSKPEWSLWPMRVRKSFELAQRLGDSAAARALTQMAARIGRGRGRLAELVRGRQDLAEQWRNADRKLLATLGAGAAERDDNLVRSLREELAGLEERIALLSAAVASEFPEYASLADPEPVPAEDVQQMLGENEALVQLLIGSYGSYAWVITKSDARWTRLEAGRRAITAKVDALRCGLDARSWYGFAGSRCQQLLQTGYHIGDYEQGKPLPFDLATAYELYRDLFGSIDDVIRDKHLLVVPSGPLTKLPLHVLVTDRPGEADRDASVDYRAAHWLGRRQALTVVPSVAALAALRSAGRGQTAPRPFIGFGNPLLSGPDGQDRRAWVVQSCRPKASPSLRQRVASAMQSIPVLGSLFRGSLADVRELSRQMPLPETADELCTIARRLGASERDVWLGGRATERNLKEISATGELARYGVLHFATHGLVAGNLTGLAEPALVLTPPEEASEVDDGLLTASEVAELDLAADWVVLSACNTAAGQGGDAEALSGLARAFFHAGARALLVSHWEVSSSAAVKLSTAAFAALADGRASGRAEAMRLAMLSMIDSGEPADAHPSNWAPFVVVGEGSGR